MRFKDQETYPAASMNLDGTGRKPDETRVFLGYREADSNIQKYHFDTETLENSGLARILEGTAATPLSIIMSLKSIGGGFDILDPSRKNRLQELEETGFSQHDRAALFLIQHDLLKRGYDASNPDMVEIEKISRSLGNKPSQGYPALDIKDAFTTKAQDFYNGLTDNQKWLFVDPHNPPYQAPQGDAIYVPFEDRLRGERAEQQRNANMKRFEDSLTPDQKSQWEKLKQEAHSIGQGFSKPKGEIPSAPDVEIPGGGWNPFLDGPKSVNPLDFREIMNMKDVMRQSSIPSDPPAESTAPALKVTLNPGLKV
jgi:hypothetical protein